MTSGDSNGYAKTVDVRFADGRGALNAYWGYLSDGGLVLDEPEPLVEGELVALNVHFESSRMQHRVCGRVVSCRPRRRQAVVAFSAGESGRFLHAALSDNRVDVVVRMGDAANLHEVATARMLNVSSEGCCVRLGIDRASLFPVGSRVRIETPRLRVDGCVVWALGNERGVLFSFEGDGEAQRAVADYLVSLTGGDDPQVSR